MSRLRNYCTNNPVLGFPPDPMVGFGMSIAGWWGLNNGILACPAPSVIATTAPPTTTTTTTSPPGVTTTLPPGVTTIPPTTLPPPTTPPPLNPICDSWGLPVFTTGTTYTYGWRVCYLGKCYTCSNVITTANGTIPQPCLSGYDAQNLAYGIPGGSSQWAHECVDSTCPTNINALDCCCSGVADCGCSEVMGNPFDEAP